MPEQNIPADLVYSVEILEYMCKREEGIRIDFSILC